MRKLSLKELNRLSVEEYKTTTKTPITLVLDNVRSALNVGAAFRTADAFALERIFLCGITATPPHREILKTAIGATESVEWVYFKDSITAFQQLKNENYSTIAIEQAEDSISLQDFDIQKDLSYALILGNEVKGVSQAIMDVVDYCIEVPQFGTKHSLNVSVCAGVVLWDFVKQMRF